MHYDVLLTKDPLNGYTARSVLIPELIVTGASEAETIERIREALAKVQEQSRIVRVEVPDPEDDPWLRFAGMWKDDPDWEQFQANIKAFRESVDKQPYSVDEFE